MRPQLLYGHQSFSLLSSVSHTHPINFDQPAGPRLDPAFWVAQGGDTVFPKRGTESHGPSIMQSRPRL
jgi:hypothetical protein